MIKEKITNILPKDITLNADQEAAIIKIYEWYNDNGRATSFTLAGAAGNGKSFCVNIIQKILPTTNVAISAPTHKAKKVVERFTGLRGVTIHSLLGLRPNTNIEEFDINNVRFDSKVEPQLKYYKLIIIDESSMINTDLYNLIIKEATANRTKILFIGDPLQLPPVGEHDSPVFEKAVSIAWLHTPVRQSTNNPLYLLLMALRYEIEKSDKSKQILNNLAKDFNNIVIDYSKNAFTQIIDNHPLWQNYNNEGYSVVDKHEFYKQMVNDFVSDDFNTNINHCRFIAFTNDNIRAWNKVIRSRLFPDVESPLVEGDLILSYSTVYNDLQQMLLQNSEEYVVTNIEPTYSQQTLIEDGIATDTMVNTVAVMLETTDKLSTRIKVVKPCRNDEYEWHYKTFINTHRYFHNLGITKRLWRQYYKFKNNHLLLDDLKRLLKNNKYPTKDIDYAYGITVHKSQGSTFNNVYINMRNIMKYPSIARYIIKKRYKRQPNQREANNIRLFTLKLLYVALSRASKQAIILK